MEAVRFDDSRWPLLTVEFSGEYNTQVLETYMRNLEDYYRREQRFAFAVVIEKYKPDDARFIPPVAKWYAANKERFDALSVGMAMVPPSGAFRFILSSLQLIVPLRDSYSMEESLEDAVAWCEKRLRDEGIPFPS